MNYSKMTPDELAEEFIRLGTENGITMLNGDYRRGNRIVKQMNKLTDSIKDDSELFKFVLKCAMRSDDRQARGIGAAKVLQNDIEELIDEAVEVLEKDGETRDILGFGSRMALSIWRGEFPGDPNTWKKRENTSGK